MGLDTWMWSSIPNAQEGLPHPTHLTDTRQVQTILPRNRCIEDSIRSSPEAIWWQWQPKTLWLYLKSLRSNPTKIPDSWPGPIGNCTSTGSMATLPTRNSSPSAHLVWPQKPHLLFDYQNTHLLASSVVQVPFSIQFGNTFPPRKVGNQTGLPN